MDIQIISKTSAFKRIVSNRMFKDGERRLLTMEELVALSKTPTPELERLYATEVLKDPDAIVIIEDKDDGHGHLQPTFS